jgi:glutathione S-transferase
MYTLHYAPDNASLIVRLALLEMGLPFETRLVDRRANAQNSAAYLRLAPTGLIPALEMDGGVMFETGAILLALADRTGKLFAAPNDPARPDALKWLFFIATSLHSDCRLHFYPARYCGADPAPDAFTAAARARLCAHLDLIDRAAAAQPLLFWQGGPTVLALYVLVICRWLQLYPGGHPPLKDWGRWPALHDLAKQSEMRSSARSAAMAEGLGTDIFTNAHAPNPPEGSAT